MNTVDKKMLRDIERYGWHVLKVTEDSEGPAFAFTIGLYHSFKHPEVLMIGLDLDFMHSILNNIGDDVRKRLRYEEGQTYPEIVENYDCSFQKIERQFYTDYLGTAMYFYNPESFPALQCVYPDKEGRYPWHKGCSKAFREQQPVFTSTPVER